MQEPAPRYRAEAVPARTGSLGSGLLIATFAVRHRKGLDVVFLLAGSGAGFQIGLGAASDDFTTVLSLGLDDQGGVLRATGSFTVHGRRRSIPVRVIYRSASAIAVEAGSLAMSDRPSSLKSWSFARQGAHEHFSDVIGLVSPEFERLPEVPLKTRPRG